TEPTWSRGGPRRWPKRFGSWQLPQFRARYTCPPLATGSVAGGSDPHAAKSSATNATSTGAGGQRCPTTRPIMRTVEACASLPDATVVIDDRVILRDVSLEIGPGLTVLRGPNGAGKTTLLRALAGLVPLARGQRQATGELLYIGHRPMLLHGLTARAHPTSFARFRGMPADGVAGALAAWGLADRADRSIETLSAGGRPPASLARRDAHATRLGLPGGTSPTRGRPARTRL